jgi:quercetin dioxygenase-like cupin family protein
MIFPADAPREARLSGHGIRVRLESGQSKPPEIDDGWGTGRAGMQYRDLVADRLGGRLIASHIRILMGGPVPDYVHHHDVQFQLIYCYRGWVRVVYEDQGPSFILEAGDCVLQPPHIRHRVLKCSDNMEVIEVSSPAEHETFVDHELALPTPTLDANRSFLGQRFVRHQSSQADWEPGSRDGFLAKDTGIAKATNGLASVQVLKPTIRDRELTIACRAGVVFVFVLEGSMVLRRKNQTDRAMEAQDSFVIAEETAITTTHYSDELRLLHVAINQNEMRSRD